jgi:hypothetical protein
MPYQYGFIDSTGGGAANSQPPVPPSATDSDPLDVFVASQGGVKGSHSPAVPTSKSQAADPLDTFVAAQGGLPKQTSTPAMSSVLAQDLSMGGASPDTDSQLWDMAKGAAHGVGSFVNNGANLVEKSVAAGANAIPGVRGTAVGDWLANTANSDVEAQSGADQQFDQSANPGQKAAAFLAPMALPIPGAGLLGDTVGAAVKVIPRMGGTVGRVVAPVVGNAATGAVIGAAATPIDASQPYWQQVASNAGSGALLGGGVGAAAAGVGGLVNAGRALAFPFRQPEAFVGQRLAATVGNDAGAAADAIRNAPMYIPGSLPTTAQVTNIPTLVQTEKALRENAPSGFGTLFDARQASNNAARDAAGTAASGDPQALAQLQQQFDAQQAARTMQGAQQLPPAGAPTSAVPTPDLTTPEFAAIARRARAMAENEGSTAFADQDAANLMRRASPQQQMRAAQGSLALPPLGAPTTSMPAPDLSTPEFGPLIQQARAMASNEGSTAFADQAQQVNDGLLSRLRSITGEQTDLDAATAARAEKAADNFLSMKVGIPVANTDYAALKQTPAFQSAFAQAQKMARNDGASSIETQVQNRANANLGGAQASPQTYVSGTGLQYVKSALDDQIGAATRAGENATARNLMGVKNRLLGIMDAAMPDYAAARQAYGQASRPIDAMTTLQAKNLVDAAGNVSPTKIGSLIDSIQAQQRRPGFRAVDSVTPEQLAALGDLRDAALKAKSNLYGLSGEGQDYIRRAVEANGTPEAQSAFQQYLQSASPHYQQYFSGQVGDAAQQGKGSLIGLSGEGQEYLRRAAEERGTPEARAALQRYLDSTSPQYQQFYAARAGEGTNLNSAQALARGLEGIRSNTANEAMAPSFGPRNVANLERQPLTGAQSDYVAALKADVLRQELSNQRTARGSDTKYNFSAAGLPGGIYGGRPDSGLASKGAGAAGNAIGGAIGHAIFPGAGGFIGHMVGHTLGEALASKLPSPRGKLNAALSELLLNPESFAPYLHRQAAKNSAPAGPQLGLLARYAREFGSHPVGFAGLLGQLAQPTATYGLLQSQLSPTPP